MTSQRLPLKSVAHVLVELSPETIVLVLPKLLELVTVDEVFEPTDDDVFELMELLAPPSVVALTVPDFDVIVLVAA